MATLETLRSLPIVEVAARLGLEQPGGRGNYRSPHHEDKNPSLYISDAKNNWVDYSDQSGANKAGSTIDLVMYANNCTVAEACNWLRDQFALPEYQPGPQIDTGPDTIPQIAARAALADQEPAIRYLVEARKIDEGVARAAAKAKTIGWSTWTKPGANPGDFGYGGPALATIIYDANRKVIGMDCRYESPEMNGGVKSKTVKDSAKMGAFWEIRPGAVASARRVYIVESAINALTVHSAGMPGVAALAVRGLQAGEALSAEVLREKQVIICYDLDKPAEDGKMKGHSPGWAAALRLYDRLTAAGIAAMLISQDDWEYGQDINDILQQHGRAELRSRLEKLNHWAIPGLAGTADAQKSRPRVFLPPHDYNSVYGWFRVTEDVTQYIDIKRDKDGDAHQVMQQVAGFRIAEFSRIQIQSANSTLSGNPDLSPEQQFVVAVQTPRNGPFLQRMVMRGHQIANTDLWKRFGFIHDPKRFARLVQMWEYACTVGERKAANLVGLCWKSGKLVVNEGKDTYFTEPREQCPYHDLSFPRSDVPQARKVIRAFFETFGDCAALQMLVWALGAHLKAFVGFWPHAEVQAEKGTGKSYIAGRLTDVTGIKVMGRSALVSDYRILCAVSGTFHPVAWDEMSANSQKNIDAAVGTLQESYRGVLVRRGVAQTEHVLCAPVLLLGEDVPTQGLTGKVVQISLEHQGKIIPMDIGAFPVYEWLEFLTRQNRDKVREIFRACRGQLQSTSAGSSGDRAVNRMADNYSAVLTAWHLLCEFADIDAELGDFSHFLARSMNRHITTTDASREPWIWIMEIFLSEVAAGQFNHPWGVFTYGPTEELCLYTRPSWIMDHISRTPGLRQRWDALSVKSPRVFKQQMEKAGALASGNTEKHMSARHSVGTHRYTSLCAIRVSVLEQHGLTVPFATGQPP